MRSIKIFMNLTLTPVGWVVLVGTAAYLGYSAAKISDENSGALYDKIMGFFQ